MRSVLLVLVGLALASCQTIGMGVPTGGESQTQGWLMGLHVANQDQFAFKYWYHNAHRSNDSTLHVVIEGDGASWSRAGNPPRNPTPRRAMGRAIAHKLAKDGNVLYIARPCQFLEHSQMRACSMSFWTSERFSQSILVAFDKVVTNIKRQHGGDTIALYGFSGGGVLAAELAIRRSDVERLTTFASPLDLEEWTRYHEITPVRSPTPSQMLLEQLADKQIFKEFYFGHKDSIVPPASLSRLRKILPPNSVHLHQRFGHESDWASLVP